MWKHQIVEYLRKEAKTITIEPILFLNAFGISTVMGAQVSISFSALRVAFTHVDTKKLKTLMT
jgi:hypothetical protein